MKPTIAVSVGDLNGIGIEIALRTHEKISKYCKPIYCINTKMLKRAAKELNIEIPEGFKLHKTKGEFNIKPGYVSKRAGKFSYDSFCDAINLASKGLVDGICTLPINKESWNKADIRYKGHTEVLETILVKMPL